MRGRSSVGPAITAGALLTLLCACGENPIDPSTGSIQVQTQSAAATAETAVDTDGYTVVVSGIESQDIEPAGTATFTEVVAGEYTVELEGLQENCTAPSSPARVTVVAGGTALVSFAVTCWPPPSGRIIFSRTVDHPVLGPASVSNIYVMDADGTDFQQLTDVDAKSSQPMWSPDNQKIVFKFVGTGMVGFASEIFVMNADGTGRTNLTLSTFAEASPAWSPDGSKIAFSRNVDDDWGIYVMNADGSDVVRLTDGGNDPAWSPDGSSIAFNCDGDVCVMNSDGTGTVNLTNTIMSSDWVSAGSWSPDGEKILFNTNRRLGGGDLDVYVMNADGTNPVALTFTSATEWGGSWSPDGTKIAFSVQGLTGPSIYYVNADGTGRVSLTEDMEPGVWSSQANPFWSHGS
ncbi:hypothetical protein ACFL3B_02750 [Gemmatimonadota bacterium]